MGTIWTNRLIAITALLAGLTAPVSADVKYTMESGQGGQGMNISTTTYIQGMHKREETSMHVGPMNMGTTTLTLCDKHQTVKLDADLKLYTVGPVGGAGALPPAPGTMHRPAAEQSGDGVVETTYKVEDLGTEKVASLDTHHVMITMHIVSSGCAGNSDQTTKLEEWTSKIHGFSCPDAMAPQRVVQSPSGCKIKYVVHGDAARMGSILAGMPARIKMYSGDRVVMMQELKEYSEAPLDGGLFVVPSDYKQVSEAEFQQGVQQKMMRQMPGMPQPNQ